MQGPIHAIDQADFAAQLGQEFGVSAWRAIDQHMINAFATLTDDHQLIHVDERIARLTPFGGTIAHGFLVLSMLTAMSYEVVPAISGAKMGVNYGFDRVRFISPVRSGARIRGRFSLTAFDPFEDGRIRIGYGAVVEIEYESKLAVRADWISMVWT